MAKFCTNCGKELKDGKTCNCKKTITKEENKINEKPIFDRIINFVKKPIDSIDEFIGEDKIDDCLIILFANILLISLFIGIAIKKIPFFLINHFSGNFYMEYFFGTFTYITIFYLLISLISYIIFKIQNKEVTYKQMIEMLTPMNICSSISILISTILIPVSLLLSVLVLTIGIITSIIIYYETLKKITNDFNQLLYIVGLNLIIPIFLISIIL